jgi:hypothetical protein
MREGKVVGFLYLWTLIRTDKYEEAAREIFNLALRENIINVSLIAELRTVRDKYPKLMYYIEDLLNKATAEEHDKVVGTLDSCGWYGTVINHPTLKVVYIRPANKVPPPKTDEESPAEQSDSGC